MDPYKFEQFSKSFQFEFYFEKKTERLDANRITDHVTNTNLG